MMKNIFKTIPGWDQILIGSSYLYLVIPILIFFFGWLKLPLALVSAAILLAGTYFTLRDFGYIKDYSFISLNFLVFSILIVFAWVFFSGIGGFGHQNWDFQYRNAVLRDLINYPWPVIYDYSGDSLLKEMFGNTGALVYYFAYWLPSALVGKLLGWKMANLVLFFWSIFGVSLCIMLMTRYIKKASILVVLAFVIFGGLDIIGHLWVKWPGFVSDSFVEGVFSTRELLGVLFAEILNSGHLEMWTARDNYSFLNYNSHTVQLFWVFNQSIPAWLVTLLLLNLKQAKSLLYTFSLVFFFAPLTGIGLIPYLAYKMIAPLWGSFVWGKDQFILLLKTLFHTYFSFQNTVVVLMMAGFIAAFYGTQAGNHPHGFIWDLHEANMDLAIIYLAFIILEFLIFGLFTFNNKENRGLLILTLIWLSVIPLYHYSVDNDFGLKASIPPLIILFTVGFKNILNKFEGPLPPKKQLARVLLVLVLVITSIGPLHEFFRSQHSIVHEGGFPDYYEPQGSLSNSDSNNSSGQKWKLTHIPNFVVGNPEDTWFFRYLARK